MSQAINAGIIALLAQQHLNAVSCMALAPAFAEGAPALRAMPAQLGLHLDLTECGWPQAVWPLPELLLRSWSRQLDLRRVRDSVQRQLDAFELRLGAAPHYVDGHQHVHQLPGVRDTLLSVLAQRYGDAVPWLRCGLPGSQQGQGWRDAGKARVIGLLGARGLRNLARRQGVRTNRRLLGVYGLAGGERAYRQRLYQWLSAAQDGDLLMCHPAKPEALETGALARQRAAEYAVLSDPLLRPWLHSHGLTLAS